MVTRRAVKKSQAEELVDDKRRAMRAELAEALGRATSRRLQLDDQVRQPNMPQPPALYGEPLRRHVGQQERTPLERRALVAAHAGRTETRQAMGQVRRLDAAGLSTVPSPYARGKTAQPRAGADVSVRQAQDQAQQVAKRGVG